MSDVNALYRVTHQWTTDQYGMTPPPSTCGGGPVSLECVPDSAGVDAGHPNGAYPLLLPPGVSWDGSGGNYAPGVLTFGPGSALPAGTLHSVVDTRQSFSVGAWLTSSAAPAGAPATAVAEEGPGGTGFELGLTAAGQRQFRVHTASGEAAAVDAGITSPGIPVYVAGVADAVNHEVRLYVNGALAAVTGFTPAKGHAPDGVATVGGRLDATGTVERWTGQVGNPVVAQAALPTLDLSLLSSESFFPGSDLG